jgi:hypothetical protein
LKKLSFRTSRSGSLTGEAPVPYGDDFGVKNEEKEPENTYFLNTNLE